MAIFGSSTHAITSDVQTDGEKSMQANMGASYEGGVKIYAPNSWNWSDQKELVFDIVNNTNEEINYGVKILTNYVWDDANALSEYFNVPANTVLENVVMPLDSTEYGSIGASYNKAMAMEINFFAAESPNTTVYIDNIRVSDGATEPTPPPTDPEETSGRISSAPVKTLLQLETFDEITDSIELQALT
ncbi:hypothetical protein JCM19233_2991 [Vibrio astriarenae]|nr:hypothetical protein JCM19233_2991 [Vibrio sp. C7]